MYIHKIARGGKEYLLNDLKEIESFFGWLQVHCISECCGIDAFSFEKEIIENAFIENGQESILFAFQNIIEELNHFIGSEIFVPFFNHGFEAEDLVSLLKKISGFIKE